jgi:hypothetical protein
MIFLLLGVRMLSLHLNRRSNLGLIAVFAAVRAISVGCILNLNDCELATFTFARRVNEAAIFLKSV